MPDFLNIKELKTLINKRDTGILFCVGTSFISKLIQFKTRTSKTEIVPSHVAIIKDGTYLYESTSQLATLGRKTIPSGVRRYLLSDFYKLEKDKSTLYYFHPCELDEKRLEKYIHYPYGVDTIVDFALKDGSDGISKGLICSQYGNLVTRLMDKECPSPADLFRCILTLEDNLDVLQIED